MISSLVSERLYFSSRRDDFEARGGFEVEFLVGLKNAVVCVVLLGFLEEVFQRIVCRVWSSRNSTLKRFLPLLLGLEFSFHEDLDEENLGDFVEGGGGVALLPIADDVVALVEQVGELVLLEDLQALDEFLDLLVGGVGMGNVFDLITCFGILSCRTRQYWVSRWLWVTKKGALVRRA